MHTIYILPILLILKASSALDSAENARIVSYEFDNIGTGPYHFSFETSDGTKREETGELHYPNTEDETEVVTGSFSYLGPDGVVYTVKYKADDQGFHPEGDHIKVPPFVPWVHHHNHDALDQSGSEERASSTTTSPQYETGERILDTFLSAPKDKPTVQYLPAVSRRSVQRSLRRNSQVQRPS